MGTSVAALCLRIPHILMPPPTPPPSPPPPPPPPPPLCIIIGIIIIYDIKNNRYYDRDMVLVGA